MKKILLGLVMLLTTATMNAQIELEHTFNGIMMGLGLDLDLDCHMTLIGMDDMYVVTEYDDYTTYVYNEEGELRLQCSYREVCGMVIARNVMTTDNTICYVKSVKIAEGKWSIIILNERGELVKEFAEEIDKVAVRKVGNKYKLICAYTRNYGDEKTYVYSLPGNGEATTSVQNVPAKAKRNAYPNPASEIVTLPYEADDATSMKIYDVQGKLVERKFLNENEQELQLNIKDYTSGMYFYEVNGESNSFIVK